MTTLLNPQSVSVSARASARVIMHGDVRLTQEVIFVSVMSNLETNPGLRAWR